MTRGLFINLVMAVVFVICNRPVGAGEKPGGDAKRLAGSCRSEKNGWVFVHLEGKPE